MSSLAMTFDQLLSDNLPEGGARIAIIENDREITYSMLTMLTDEFLGRLEQQGISPGERVVIQFRKSAAEVAAMFAIAKLGAVIVNVNAQWTIEQVMYVVQDCGAACLMVEPRMAARLADQDLPSCLRHVLVDGVTPDDGQYSRSDQLTKVKVAVSPRRLSTDLAMIIYTSGSTGMPKGVMLSHSNILTGARSVARYLKLSSQDRLLSVLPYSFDYGLNQLTTMMLLGGTVVHQAVPLAMEIIATMERHRVTGFAAVPPLWGQVVRALNACPRCFPALRLVTNSGGGIPSNVLDKMPSVFPGVDIYLMYGLTEAFRSTYLPPEQFASKMGSIGQAIPNAEIYVIKTGEGIAGDGEEGELVHRGPLVSLGYWGQPNTTAEKIRPCPELFHLIGNEPVVYSGDTVRIDADGMLWFVGRRDTMIKTSGFRVSPDEVEDLLYRSDVVSEVVAFAVDDDNLGQAIHVAVTPLTPELSKDELLVYCRSAMPSYMVPKRCHFWLRPMPRTASGKLDRPEVIMRCTSEATAADHESAQEQSNSTLEEAVRCN